MNRTVIIAGIVVVVIVVAVAFTFPSIATTYARNRTLTRCQELEAELAAMSGQGGDQQAIAAKQAELRICYGQAEAAGAAVDLGRVRLEQCRIMLRQCREEFAHYRSTDYSDAVKRNNTRGTILRVGENFVTCVREAGNATETLPGAEEALALAKEAFAEFEAQRLCYLYDQAGCGRFAVNEPHGNDKAGDVQARILTPLLAVIDGELKPRVAALQAARTPAQALASNPSAFRAFLGRVPFTPGAV